MLSALKKVGYALGVTLLVALHGIASAAIGWFLAKVVILAVKLGVYFIKISGVENGPYGWAWIDVSDLWTYIPVGIAGVLGALAYLFGVINKERDLGFLGPQRQLSLMIVAGSFFGGFAALCGGLAGAAVGVVIRICLWIFQIPIGPPADDLIHTIPGVAIGAIAFLVWFVLGAKAGEDSSWSEFFFSSGSGSSSGGGSYGGSSYSSPSPSPTSYPSSSSADQPSYTPVSSGPVYTPPPPPPDWTIAAREQAARDEQDRMRWRDHQNKWGS